MNETFVFPNTPGLALQIYHHRTEANYDQPQTFGQIQYQKKKKNPPIYNKRHYEG